MRALAPLLLLLMLLPCAEPAPSPPLASVNMVQALWDAWGTSDATPQQAAASARAACAGHGFTALRIAASPFWPSEWRATYGANSTAFFAAARSALDALAAGGCTRLTLTLLWNIFALPDLHGEPLGVMVQGARGQAASASYAASLAYIDGLVGALHDHPAVAAWELTNELNLLMDLDQSQFCNCCAPAKGTPAARSRADNVSTEDAMALLGGWAARVRAADPLRHPISSGHGLARPAAQHLRASYLLPGRDWTLDTLADFHSNFADINACCEWASAHVYPGPDNARWNATGPEDGAIVRYLQAAAAGAGKRLLIGEFGALPGAGADPAAPRPFVDSVLAALADSAAPPGVPGVTELALLWVWEFGSQNGTVAAGGGGGPVNNGWAVWPGVTQGVIYSLVRYNGGGGGRGGA